MLYKEFMEKALNSPQKTPPVTSKWAPLWAFFAPIFVVGVFLDQVTKAWAEDLPRSTVVNLGFNLSHNDGLIFGFDLPLWGIYALTAGILLLGVYTVIENKLWQKKSHLFPLALILAGAIGNLIDRIRLGYVVDFIQVYWWPTFNLADIFIVIGVFLLGWQVLIEEETLEEL